MKADGKRIVFIALILALACLFSLNTNIKAEIKDIILISPANNAWINNDTPTFSFRAVSSSDPNFSCNLIVNSTIKGTNATVYNYTNTTIVPTSKIEQGVNKWNITCADSFEIQTSETRTVYIDTEAPNITLIDPADGEILNSRDVNFKFKVIDNLDTSLSCKLYVDGDEEKSGSASNGSTVTWTIEGLSRDSHNWQVKCEDEADNEGVSATWDFEIRGAGNFCENGEQGNGLVFAIRSPDSGDEFDVGENISVKVDVENTYTDDLDIVIEVELYDLDDEDDVVSVDYETTIDEDDENTYTLHLKIPTNVDIDHDFIIRAKVYEDGNEENQCQEDSIDVKLNKKLHNIIINSFSLSPTTLRCGESFIANLEVENTGLADEDVKISIRNLALGINYYKQFTLDSGEKRSENVKFTVPSNATETEYEIVLTAYYNLYDDTYESQTSTAKTILVRGNCFVEIKDAIVSTQQISDAFNGQEFVIKVTVTNTGTVDTTYTINVSDYETWAKLSRIDPLILTLDSGATGQAYIYLVPNINATGSNSLKVKVTFGNTTKEVPITVNIRQQTFSASWLDQLYFELKSNLLWFVIDIILVATIVVLIVFLIKEKLRNKYIRKNEASGISEIKVRTISDKEKRLKRKK